MADKRERAPRSPIVALHPAGFFPTVRRVTRDLHPSSAEPTAADQQAASTAACTGRLVVICGCMFAGKTTRLIAHLASAAAAGQTVRAFKHGLDQRYDPRHLRTHDGRAWDATPLADAADLLPAGASAQVVGVDEAHFFGGPLVTACRTLVSRGKTVIVAGIHHDAWGQSFPNLAALRMIANEVELLHAPCARCGAPAPYSQRLVPLGREDDMVGGPGQYEPRCPACFTPLPPPAPTYDNAL